MKKIVMVLLVLAVVGGSVFAFDPMSYPPPVKSGNVMLDLGIGLRSTGYSNANWKIPPLFVQAEYALPVGVPISVGGLFTISSYGYKWGPSNGNADWTWTDLTFAGRANWHWGFDVKWLDLYTGLSLGYTSSTYKSSNSAYDTGTNYSGFFFAGQLGAHFYFTNSVGVVAEFGYPYWFKVGLALKF